MKHEKDPGNHCHDRQVSRRHYDGAGLSGEAAQDCGEGQMKKIDVLFLSILLIEALTLSGCSAVLDTVKTTDKDLASYMEVETLNRNCTAGIAQASSDVSPDAISPLRVAAVTKFADPKTEDYQTCYAKTAWALFVAKKMEGAFSSFMTKLTELGILE
jgi:uncharacterized protein YceK